MTRRRMYLETMENVLGKVNKVVVDQEASGAIPYLNLNEITRDGQRRTTTPQNAQGGQ